MVIVGGYKLSEQIGTSYDNIYKKYSSKVVLPSLSEINRSDLKDNRVHEQNLLMIISLIILMIVPSILFSDILVRVFLDISGFLLYQL